MAEINAGMKPLLSVEDRAKVEEVSAWLLEPDPNPPAGELSKEALENDIQNLTAAVERHEEKLRIARKSLAAMKKEYRKLTAIPKAPKAKKPKKEILVVTDLKDLPPNEDTRDGSAE